MDIPVAELKRLTKEDSNDIVIVSPIISGLWNNNQPDPNSYFYPDIYHEGWKDIYSGSTTQLTTFKQTFLPIQVANNFKILKASFEKERRKSSISEDIINNLFQQLAVKIAELPFEKSAVEITSSDSIKISMAFSDNLLLILSKPFETLEDVSENDIIFSLFKNREMIASNVSKTTDFVEGFKRFLLL
jgi:hypothetical protein